MRIFSVILIAAFAGCGEPPVDATDDLTNLVPEGGKADSVTLSGSYEITSDTLSRNDFLAVQFSGAQYVRAHCYGAGCSTLVPQWGRFELVRSGSTRYVRFYVSHVDPPAPAPPPGAPMSPKSPKTNPPATTPPAPADDLADTYAYSLTGKTLKLRKVYTSRWFTMTKASDRQLCGDSGGTWSASAGCDCGGGDYTNGGQWFAPGLGGCAPILIPSESLCDDTGGGWTDDEADAINTFCECGVGRYWVDGTGCHALP